MDTSKLTKFPEGSVILNEGEQNLDMYKIIHGHAELYNGYGTDKEVVLGILGPGSCFGEFGLLLKQPAIYTVVAYSDVFAMRVTEGELGDFVQHNHHDIINIMRNMSRMMIVMQQQINLLAGELQEHIKVDDEVIDDAKHNLRDYALGREHFKLEGKMRYFDRSIRR